MAAGGDSSGGRSAELEAAACGCDLFVGGGAFSGIGSGGAIVPIGIPSSAGTSLGLSLLAARGVPGGVSVDLPRGPSRWKPSGSFGAAFFAGGGSFFGGGAPGCVIVPGGIAGRFGGGRFSGIGPTAVAFALTLCGSNPSGRGGDGDFGGLRVGGGCGLTGKGSRWLWLWPSGGALNPDTGCGCLCLTGAGSTSGGAGGRLQT